MIFCFFVLFSDIKSTEERNLIDAKDIALLRKSYKYVDRSSRDRPPPALQPYSLQGQAGLARVWAP
jgi:hypothetical protein